MPRPDPQQPRRADQDLGTVRYGRIRPTFVLACCRVLEAPAVGWVIGAVLALTVTIAVGILGEEVFAAELWRSGLETEHLWRGSAGGMLAGVLGAVLALILGVIGTALAAPRALERHARERPGIVPVDADLDLVRRFPRFGLRMLAWTMIGVAGLVLLTTVTLPEHWDEPGMQLTTAIAAAVAVLGGGLLLLRSWEPRRLARMQPLLDRWAELAPEADAERRRARARAIAYDGPDLPGRAAGRMLGMLARTGRFGLIAGAVVFFIGVVLRQPGRNASRQSYGPTIESVIDAAVLVGTVLAAAGLVVWLIPLAARFVIQVRRELAVRRVLADGRPRRLRIERVPSALGLHRLEWRLVVILSAIAPVAFGLGLSAVFAAAPAPAVVLLVIAAATGPVLVLVLAFRAMTGTASVDERDRMLIIVGERDAATTARRARKAERRRLAGRR
ncbi:hypothetical protein [Agromyces seonyuensis]|uniref:Uncharacterized protein n=1 Tax=Agromyces seonyuensis TaxID=2662446 RepID=A0A6I4P656_9MICO|nr:hypothetical protein [Agromyces seonyuensis]MWC00010.1 hypothetical protein [Agromyces seonyuensis]